MTIAKIASAHIQGGSGTPYTTSPAIDTTAGAGADLLVVVASAYGLNAGTCIISDSASNAGWTKAVANTGVNGIDIAIFYCTSPTKSGSHTVTIAHPGVGVWGGCDFMAFSGTNGFDTGVINSISSNGGANTAQPGSVTPTANGALLIFGASPQYDTSDITVVDIGTLDTHWAWNGSSGGIGAAWYVQTTAAAINPTFSISQNATCAAAIASFKAAAGGGNVTVAATGVSTTGSPGSVALQFSVALSGVAETSHVGTVAAAETLAITGNAATGSTGTVAPAITVALTGVAATGTVGTVTAPSTGTAALTGVSSTGSVGTVTPEIDGLPTGVAGAGSAGSVGVAITVPITGVAATGAPGDVSAGSDITTSISGVAATGAVGALAPAIAVDLTGVEAAGSVGNVVREGGDVTIGITGVSATGSAGSVSASGAGENVLSAKYIGAGKKKRRNVEFKPYRPEDPLPAEITNMPDAPVPPMPISALLARGLDLDARIFPAAVEPEPEVAPAPAARRPTPTDAAPRRDSPEEPQAEEVTKPVSPGPVPHETVAGSAQEIEALRAELSAVLAANKATLAVAEQTLAAVARLHESMLEARNAQTAQEQAAEAISKAQDRKARNARKAAELAAKLLLEDDD